MCQWQLSAQTVNDQGHEPSKNDVMGRQFRVNVYEPTETHQTQRLATQCIIGLSTDVQNVCGLIGIGAC